MGKGLPFLLCFLPSFRISSLRCYSYSLSFSLFSFCLSISSFSKTFTGCVVGWGDVTESKLILLTPQQASKSRDKLLGQGRATLFRELAYWKDGGLVSQRTIPLELKIEASFILNGEGLWLVVANFLESESSVITAVHIGQVTMFL